MQQSSMCCVLWHIPSFTLIKSMYNLCCINSSSDLYLVGKTPFTFSFNVLVANAYFGDFLPLKQLLISTHYKWIWASHKPCHFKNILILFSSHNNLFFIKVMQIFIFLYNWHSTHQNEELLEAGLTAYIPLALISTIIWIMRQ